jgi:DNA-binding NarL/FixJ family response regulator
MKPSYSSASTVWATSDAIDIASKSNSKVPPAAEVIKKPKFLLADAHALVAEGLTKLLEGDFEIVGMVHDGRAAVSAVRDLKPDVVLLDISMPLLNGIDAAREIRKLDDRVKIVILSMYREVSYVEQAFAAGASAYVIRDCAGKDLRQAIWKALMGQRYVTPALIRGDVFTLLHTSQVKKRRDLAVTPRQLEVLQLLAEGRSAKEVASMLNLSPRTVEFHKYRLMQRLGIQNTTSLVRFAMRNGIIGG